MATAMLHAQTSPTAAAPLGVVQGSVVDVDGDGVPHATITVTSDAIVAAHSVVAGDDGTFEIDAVPPGKLHVTASAEGFAPVSVDAVLAGGGEVTLDPIALKTATAQFTISALSPHDVAEVEVKQAEQQRLLGVLPNFTVSYNWNAPPLDTRQKFELATRATIDPTTFAITAGIVLGERWSGKYQEFGNGATGFLHLYGVSLADVAVGNELGGAILPTVFHQDPRYFWKGTGSTRSRATYAISRAVIARGDNGRDQFGWSGVLGDFGAGAISNLYYPRQDRGASLTLINGALNVGADAVNNLLQEFIFKHITPGSRKRPPVEPIDPAAK